MIEPPCLTTTEVDASSLVLWMPVLLFNSFEALSTEDEIFHACNGRIRNGVYCHKDMQLT